MPGEKERVGRRGNWSVEWICDFSSPSSSLSSVLPHPPLLPEHCRHAETRLQPGLQCQKIRTMVVTNPKVKIQTITEM